MGAWMRSPTVNSAYARDRNWWYKNGGGENDTNVNLDKDGYDSYGYSGENGRGPDRAGNTEVDYLGGEWVEYEDGVGLYEHPLQEQTYTEWGVDENGLPKRK